jgi:hypothetical protein
VSDTLSTESILHGSVSSARAALESVGCDVVGELQLEVDAGPLGKLVRVFGVVGNVVERRSLLRHDILYRRVSHLLESVDNERVAERLDSGRLKFLPMNKRTATKLSYDVHELGLHLPWAFRPMNFDLGVKLEAHAKARPFPFKVYYSRGIDISADGSEVTLKRVFSLPVLGSAHGTFQEPIYDEMLDEDVGLILEANVRV